MLLCNSNIMFAKRFQNFLFLDHYLFFIDLLVYYISKWNGKELSNLIELKAIIWYKCRLRRLLSCLHLLSNVTLGAIGIQNGKLVSIIFILTTGLALGVKFIIINVRHHLLYPVVQ